MNIFSAFYLSVEDDHDKTLFNVFKYDPFGGLETLLLINVTSSVHLREYFSDKVPNYRKHPLRIVKFPELNSSGTEIQFWESVGSVFNASVLTAIRSSASNDSEIDFVKLDADVLSYEMRVIGKPTKLYPHRQSVLVMIAPHSQPYIGFVAYLQNGTWTLFFFYTFIVIVAASLLLIVSGYLRKNELFLFRSVVDVVNLLINDNVAIRYQNLCRADVFIIVPLTFTGLVAMNGILSIFQSYLTSPIYQPQISTIEDLHTSSVPILASKTELEGLIQILEDLSKYSDWSDKFYEMHLDQLQIEVDSFNNTIAFFAFDYQAQLYLEGQKRLNWKAFHLLKDTFLAKYLISFDIRLNFPFIEHINDIIHWLNGAGLINKWVKNDTDIDTLCRMNFNRRFKLGDESQVGKFAGFTVVWCGWIASTIVFIGELMWDKFRKQSILLSRP